MACKFLVQPSQKNIMFCGVSGETMRACFMVNDRLPPLTLLPITANHKHRPYPIITCLIPVTGSLYALGCPLYGALKVMVDNDVTRIDRSGTLHIWVNSKPL